MFNFKNKQEQIIPRVYWGSKLGYLNEEKKPNNYKTEQ